MREIPSNYGSIQLGDIVALCYNDRDILGVVTKEEVNFRWTVTWTNDTVVTYPEHEIWWLREHWNLLTNGTIQSRISI